MPAFGPLPRIALSVIIGFALSLFVGVTTGFENFNLNILILPIFLDLQKPPKYWSVFPFVGFGTGMLWIYIEANEILNILTALGNEIHLSSTGNLHQLDA